MCFPFLKSDLNFQMFLFVHDLSWNYQDAKNIPISWTTQKYTVQELISLISLFLMFNLSAKGEQINAKTKNYDEVSQPAVEVV